jgi:hypothetical protein
MSGYRWWGGFTGVKTSIDWGLHFCVFEVCPPLLRLFHTQKRNRSGGRGCCHIFEIFSFLFLLGGKIPTDFAED